MVSPFSRVAVRVRAALSRDDGATAVEYGLIVGLLAVAVIAIFAFFGPAITGVFQAIADQLTGVTDDLNGP